MVRFSHACAGLSLGDAFRPHAGLRGKAMENSINNEDRIESVPRDYKRDNLNREPSSLPSPASEG
jgi:hypothetical protein